MVDSNVPEYTVSYFSNALPYGYAVVVFQNHEAIVKEANVNPGQEGIYTDLVDTVIDVTDTSRKNLDIDKQIVELAPMQYGVVAKKKSDKTEKIYDNFGNEIRSEETKYYTTEYNNNTSIMIRNWNKNSYKVLSSVVLKKYNSRPELLSEDYIESLTGKYCCVVQALLQIAYMEKLTTLQGTKIKSTYNTLWKYCDVEVDYVERGVKYGGAGIYDAKSAFVKFAKEKGYKKTSNHFLEWSPSINWIKERLKNNEPIALFYKIRTKYGKDAHTISVLGLKRAKKKSSGNTWNYLMVYDGWHDTVSYINYSTVDFADCKATYFTVKK